MIRKYLIAALLAAMFGVITYGQFADCSTGLLQAPTAEMQQDGTFMITNNFLNKHSLASSGWDYNTFQYGIYISLWERIELGYVCTIFNGDWSPKPDKTERERILKNQDRHFVGRVCLLKESEFGLEWMPSLVLGVSDPLTGTGDSEYASMDDVTRAGNGYFNRNYIVLTKHLCTHWGTLGTHLGYQYNRRADYPINSLCAGISWQPTWVQNKGLIDSLSLIAEYDSRTFNFGFIVSLWQNHIETMFELQNFRWVY